MRGPPRTTLLAYWPTADAVRSLPCPRDEDVSGMRRRPPGCMLRPVVALRALRALHTGSTESDRATAQETHALPSRSPLVGRVARPRHPQVAGLQRCATTRWVHRSAQLPAAPGCAAAVCSRRARSTTRSACRAGRPGACARPRQPRGSRMVAHKDPVDAMWWLRAESQGGAGS